MDRYIEVVGMARLVESVVRYRADVTVQVRAAQVETAIREVAELRADCIRRLREGGLAESELMEGGSEVWRPWFWKKKPGQEASQKLLVVCDDMQRLMRALGALEPAFENPRYSLSVSMQRPEFQAEPDARRAAEQAAFADAEAKAGNLAALAGLALGSAAEIEELGAHVSRSGSFGDEDWRGIMMAGAASPGDEDATIEAATRSSMLRFRVRFSVAAK